MLDQLLREHSRAERRPPASMAVISRTVSSESAGVWVTLKAVDRQIEFGPFYWQPRYDVGAETVTIDYPAKGDDAVVIWTDDHTSGWVLYSKG